MIQGTMTFSSAGEDLTSLSDADLLSRAKGEPALFALLVRRYEQPFLRRARTVLRDTRDAEEAVQDAFTKIYLYADHYRPQEGATFASWAYTILNRVSYTKYTSRRREAEGSAELEPEHFESLPDTAPSFEYELSIRNEVLSVLAKLPEKAARLLRLQFIEGKSQEEIAASERLSVSAVKTRVHRAKKLFKKIYDTERYDA
jgi:RNA polymerase sigma-70 factor (ECF subfamily)